jgi:hypothetical protein
MITEAFQVILKYVAPGQEDIVIQNVYKKLSFAFRLYLTIILRILKILKSYEIFESLEIL